MLLVIPAAGSQQSCLLQEGDQSPASQRTRQNGDMRRTNSFSNWEALHNVWTAAEVIKAAGYPLEQHTVITTDGYKLRMERLPRTGAPLDACQTNANATPA